MNLSIGLYDKDWKWLSGMDKLAQNDTNIEEFLTSILCVPSEFSTVTKFVLVKIDEDDKNVRVYTVEELGLRTMDEALQVYLKVREKLGELVTASKLGSMAGIDEMVDSMSFGETKWVIKMIAYGSWSDFSK